METRGYELSEGMASERGERLPELLSPEECAALIKVSRAHSYALLADGRIKSIKIGRSRRVPVDELRAWIHKQLSGQGA